MALIMGQAAIAGTATAFTIPPGGCSITVYSAAATTLYLGTSKVLTASNGYAVSTYPTTFCAYNSSAGATVSDLCPVAMPRTVSEVELNSYRRSPTPSNGFSANAGSARSCGSKRS